jgi:tripartite-type tricarboxylate transporter receptor subunit TctC
VFGPPGLPGPVVATLNKTLIGILADDKIKQRLVTVGVVVKGSTAAEFGAFMNDETKKWNAVREAAGIAQQ